MMDKQTEEAVLNLALAQTEEMFRQRVLEVLTSELEHMTIYGATSRTPLQRALVDFLTQRISMHVTLPQNNTTSLPVHIYSR
jgi:phage terminase large subunit GpA-like protein